jgi:phosphoglycolate phosphatase-like HAD superfamily hydrolase
MIESAVRRYWSCSLERLLRSARLAADTETGRRARRPSWETRELVNVLALDFDGVISDSAAECFLVALRSYLEMSREGLWEISATRMEATLNDAPLLPSPTLESVRALPLYRRFLRLMPLGNRAEDFAVALCALEADAEPADQAAYDRFKASHSDGFLAAFHQRFYAERHAWSRADPKGWISLVVPYPEFVALLRRRAADVVLALATAKDRVSVDMLLRSYGVAGLFEPELVCDKESGVSKRAHLHLLSERIGCGFEQITFVDDKVNHLDDVSPLGVRCALAAWGYNASREQQAARDRGYLVCSLENAESELFPRSALGGAARGG